MPNLQAAEFPVDTPAVWGATAAHWDHFARTLGLERDLLPVVANPDAPISENSRMRGKGKTPSQYNRSRKVVGIPEWTKHQASGVQVRRWAGDPDLGICVQTRHMRALDVDVVDQTQATEIMGAIDTYLIGNDIMLRPPVRTRGNSPKFLLPIWLEGTFSKRTIRTMHGMIEFLGDGQQFVAASTHPSGVRYEWAGDAGAVQAVDRQSMPVKHAIPRLTQAQFEGLWSLLQERFGVAPSTEARRSGAQPTRPRTLDDAVDPLLDFLERRNWVVDYQADGRVDVTCPWADGHSVDSGPSSTTYFPRGVGGFQQGHFKCLHASCAQRTDGDFFEAVGWSSEGLPMVLTQAEYDGMVLSDGVPEGVEVQIVDAQEEAEQALIKARNTSREEGDKVDFTDAGNVNLLAKLTHGDLRYVHEFKLWINWTGQRWEQDPTHTVAYAHARRVGDSYAAQAARLKKQIELADPSLVKGLQKQLTAVQAHEKACRSRRGIENMLALATRDGRFVIRADQLDRDPYLLGVQNGVVDLRTAELRPDARDEFITLRCDASFHADAKAPRFRQLVDEVTGSPIEPERRPDGGVVAATVGRYTQRPNLARYLQKALGYSISAVTREQKLFTTYGADGSNGKNQLMEAVLQVVGPYGVRARPALLMTNRRSEQDANNATPALKALEYKRLVVLSEPDANCIIDNGVLKAITGDKVISGRANYGAETNIEVTFHLWMLANVKPPLDHMEPAVVGRIAMLPFDRSWNRPGTVQRNPTLPDGDPLLGQKLEQERDGILLWLVEGAAAYFAEGLTPCAEVQSTTVGYLNDQDPVARWLTTYDSCAPRNGTSASELYVAFGEWLDAEGLAAARGNGSAPGNETAFGRVLKAKGVARERLKGISMYGLRQKSVEDLL